MPWWVLPALFLGSTYASYRVADMQADRARDLAVTQLQAQERIETARRNQSLYENARARAEAARDNRIRRAQVIATTAGQGESVAAGATSATATAVAGLDASYSRFSNYVDITNKFGDYISTQSKIAAQAQTMAQINANKVNPWSYAAQITGNMMSASGGWEKLAKNLWG